MPRHLLSHRRSRGFTLIELLVVISIIALLIGILLPALGSARYTARVLACSTQMQQIGRAIAAYNSDNDDYYPVLFEGNEVTWDDLLGRAGYDGRTLSDADVQGPELIDDSYELYQCPLDDFDRDYFGQPAAARTYVMSRMNLNGVVNTLRGISGTLADGSPGSRRVDDVINGSQTIAVFESMELNVGASPIVSTNVLGSGLGVGTWPIALDTRFESNVARHVGHHQTAQDGVAATTNSDLFAPNFLFADSHVSALAPMETMVRNRTGSALTGSLWDKRTTLWDATF